MAKKKITIEEAFATLESAGIQIQVKGVSSIKEEAPLQVIEEAPVEAQKAVRLGKATMRVTLFARHSIGVAGVTVGTGDNKHIEGNSYETYGPGVVYVPSALAGQLLHQDALARAADERMLDRKERSYFVVQKVNPSGQKVNVGIEVESLDFSNNSDKFIHL